MISAFFASNAALFVACPPLSWSFCRIAAVVAEYCVNPGLPVAAAPSFTASVDIGDVGPGGAGVVDCGVDADILAALSIACGGPLSAWTWSFEAAGGLMSSVGAPRLFTMVSRWCYNIYCAVQCRNVSGSWFSCRCATGRTGQCAVEEPNIVTSPQHAARAHGHSTTNLRYIRQSSLATTLWSANLLRMTDNSRLSSCNDTLTTQTLHILLAHLQHISQNLVRMLSKRGRWSAYAWCRL